MGRLTDTSEEAETLADEEAELQRGKDLSLCLEPAGWFVLTASCPPGPMGS